MEDLIQEYYDHGVEMASEIPTSQKASGFNIAWNANHKGEPGKAEARRAYNRGWRDYKNGTWKPEPSIFNYPLVWLAIGGVAIWWYMSIFNDTATTEIYTAPVTTP